MCTSTLRTDLIMILRTGMCCFIVLIWNIADKTEGLMRVPFSGYIRENSVSQPSGVNHRFNSNSLFTRSCWKCWGDHAGYNFYHNIPPSMIRSFYTSDLHRLLQHLWGRWKGRHSMKQILYQITCCLVTFVNICVILCQVKECTQALLRFAKKTNVPVLLVRIHCPNSDCSCIYLHFISPEFVNWIRSVKTRIYPREQKLQQKFDSAFIYLFLKRDGLSISGLPFSKFHDGL